MRSALPDASAMRALAKPLHITRLLGKEAQVSNSGVAWDKLNHNQFVCVSSLGYICCPAVPSTVAFTSSVWKDELLRFASSDIGTSSPLAKRIATLLRGPCSMPLSQLRELCGSRKRWKAYGLPPYNVRNPHAHSIILVPAFHYFVHMPINVFSLGELVWPRNSIQSGTLELSHVLRTEYAPHVPQSSCPIAPSDVPSSTVRVALRASVVEEGERRQNVAASAYESSLQVAYLTPSLVIGVSRDSFTRFVAPVIRENCRKGDRSVSVRQLALYCGWSFEFGAANGSALLLRYLQYFRHQCDIF